MFWFSSRTLLMAGAACWCVAFAGCGDNPPPGTAPDLSRLAPIELGKPIFFGRGGEGDRMKLTGWAGAEAPFTWTDGIAASIAVRLPTTHEPVEMKFRMCGMNVPKRVPFQRVDVYINSEKVVRWEVADEKVFSMVLPDRFLAQPDPLLIIDFYMPNATSPAAIGVGGDGRRLGIRLSELTIAKATPPAVVPEQVP